VARVGLISCFGGQGSRSNLPVVSISILIMLN
jgi:hypothetical protein